MGPKWYVLNEQGGPVEAASALEGAKAFDDPRRIVAQQEIGNVRVSTIFLGLDHGFGEGPPLLWETMIFGGTHDKDQWRYSSRADAVAGHEAAVALVLSDSA